MIGLEIVFDRPPRRIRDSFFGRYRQEIDGQGRVRGAVIARQYYPSRMARWLARTKRIGDHFRVFRRTNSTNFQVEKISGKRNDGVPI